MNLLQTQQRSARRKQTGMTLLELMVVLAVMAITLAIGVPSFQGIVSDNRMTGTANTMIGALNAARSEAIKRGRSVAMTAISTDWSNGWTIDVVTPADNIKTFAATTGMTVSSATTSYTFLPTGFLALATAQEITICDSARTAETGRKISISVSGRLAVNNATCS